ncbi:MAG: hypothetical protein AB7H88_15540 [Vicinamibacterales bacterium]
MQTSWLNVHARYQCRHSGACCSSGWPIPVEVSRVAALDRAVAAGRLDAGGGPWLDPAPGAPEEVAGVFRHDGGGRCVFRQAGRCAVHQALGPGALPAACLHFPRVCLVDDRGVFVTLSHYCPTTAALTLDFEGPVAVVAGPPAIPGGDIPEGLDARGELPPLFDERRLMSLDEYAAWERAAVTRLGAAADPAAVIDALEMEAGGAPRRRDTLARFDEVCAAVPAPLDWPPAPADADEAWRELAASLPGASAVAGRYLAARAFASWVAYQGRGLQAVVRSLDAAFAVFRVEVARQRAAGLAPRDALREALRQSDLLLVHYADRQALADAWSRA